MEARVTEKILKELENLYPDAAPALHFNSAYELLVAVILSAQCTDERVNKVTAVLFQNYDTPEKMLTLTQEELQKYIFSCGFYRNKAALAETVNSLLVFVPNSAFLHDNVGTVSSKLT